MLNDSDNLFNSLSENEKISIVDQVLNLPTCPIPKEAIPFLTKEHKLDLFDKLVREGSVKFTPYQQKTETNVNRTFSQNINQEQTTSSEIYSVWDSNKLYSIIGTDIEDEDIEIGISLKAREQGLTIVGENGTGKSALISNLIHQDTKNNLGLALLDSHGDITKTVISSMPENRLKDVIYVNLEDVDFPVGLNLFECPRLTISDMAKTASFVYHVFSKIWQLDNASSPRLLQVLRALTLTLIENPGSTLSEAPLILSSHTIREKMIEKLTNQEIILFWANYNRRSQRDKDELTASTVNKISSFLDEPMIRNIVSQSKSTINLREVMDSGKILLVQLSPQFEEASVLIGSILIGKLLLSAMSRTDTPEENRRQFNLYIDEVQRFQTPDLATLISEARKFRISTTSANQVLGQLTEENRASLLAAGNLIVFRVSGDDAKALAKNFDTSPIHSKEIIGEAPIRAVVADVISHLVTRGHNDARVARFSQIYLKNLVNFVSKPPHVGLYGPPSNMPSDYKWQGVVVFEHSDIYKARELLNESLYRCMVEKTTHFIIPPLALYMLAVAQQDRSDRVFEPYLKAGWWEDNYLRGFKDGVEVFGDPNFISQEYATRFIDSRWKREKQAAIAFIKMATELRYTMAMLAQHPILVDTGQYQPKYQNRTYADMENEISRDLTQQPNFQAKVKLLTGEYTIQTIKPTGGIEDDQKEARIRQIQQQTRQNYCKPRTAVETEIRERQEALRFGDNATKTSKPQPRHGKAADEPPPTYY